MKGDGWRLGFPGAGVQVRRPGTYSCCPRYAPGELAYGLPDSHLFFCLCHCVHQGVRSWLSASNLGSGALEFIDLGYYAQLCVASGDLNSGFHACLIGVLSTDPCLQEPKLDLFSCWDSGQDGRLPGQVDSLPSPPWFGWPSMFSSNLTLTWQHCSFLSHLPFALQLFCLYDPVLSQLALSMQVLWGGLS